MARATVARPRAWPNTPWRCPTCPKVPDTTPGDDSSLDDEMAAVVAEDHCRRDRQMISDFAALTVHVMWGGGRRDAESLAESLKTLEDAVSSPHDLIEIIGAVCREMVRQGTAGLE